LNSFVNELGFDVSTAISRSVSPDSTFRSTTSSLRSTAGETRALLGCPEGTSEKPSVSTLGCRQKVASPEGTAEACLRRKAERRGRQVQSHTASFSRPFGTCVSCGLVPGVKTPGYSRDVPPGQWNVASTIPAEQATRFVGDAIKRISRQCFPLQRKNRLEGPDTSSNFADLLSKTTLPWATVDSRGRPFA
jgi:hypothetical protein